VGRNTAQPVNPAPDPEPRDADGFGRLDRGLPMNAGVLDAAMPYPQYAALGNPYDADSASVESAPEADRIPWVAAGFVLIACLTAGAATAAYVFHDRVAQLTAARASR
jgi:hypothetical protein